MIAFLIKSRVAAHVRKEATGHLTLVKEYQDKRVKKQEIKTPKATVTKLPDLNEIAKKVANPYKVSKYQEPRVLDNPVIETKNGETTARIIDTHHVARKPGVKDMKAGAAVKYRQEGVDIYMRNGNLVKETPNAWFIMPKRSRNLFKPEILKLDKKRDTLMSVEDYNKKVAVKEKTGIITSEGDRTMARHNLTAEELLRRKTVVEQRLGYSESRIVEHPSFIGPAIKIVSELAAQNGISAALKDRPNAILWHQAIDQNYGEMLHHYFLGALKAWRRVLANPLTDAAGKRLPDAEQTENNVREFKDVLAGKRHSSYAHFVMEKEGKGATISWLQELRRNRDLMQDKDISDMHEDPAARHLLAERSTAPKQLAYTLHVNKETVADDVGKIVNALDPLEREIIRIKFGFGEYGKVVIDGKEVEDRAKLSANNEKIAEILNRKGVTNGKLKWTRNTIGEKVTEIIKKLASTANKEELSYHVDEAMGRPVWKSLAAAIMDDLIKSVSDDLTYTPTEANHPKTICVDFDGPIADNSKGFQGPDMFGEPVQGAADSMLALQKEGWRIIVFTSRPDTPMLRAYLAAHQIPYDAVNEGGEGSPKPKADVYLDDRAIRFESWDQAAEDVIGIGAGFAKSQDADDSVVYLYAATTRLPKELHPEGLFKAGGVEYEIRHEGDEAVLVAGCFDDLFKAIQDGLLIEEVAADLEKSHVKEHLRHTKNGGVAVVKEHEDNRSGHKREFKVGDIVKFHTPVNDNEKRERHRIIEDRGDRVLVADATPGIDWGHIVPQSAYNKEDLVHAEDGKGVEPLSVYGKENPGGFPHDMPTEFEVEGTTVKQGGNKSEWHMQRVGERKWVPITMETAIKIWKEKK